MANLKVESSSYEALVGTAGATLTNGDLLTVGVCNVFPIVDIVNGKNYTGVLKAEKVIATKATGALAFGAAAYWQTASKDVAGTGDIYIGTVNKAALSGAATVEINFDGTAASNAGEAAEPKILVQKIIADASTAVAITGLSEGDEIVCAHVICTAANASGTFVIEDGAGADITDGMICAVDKVVVPAGTIDDTYSTLPATGAAILSVGGTAANTRGIIVITYIPVAV